MTSIIPKGTACFEVVEIFVEEEYRNQGIGRSLFEYMESNIDDEYIVLSTATKNHKAILHFYIDEVGMNFHSAFLFKKTEKWGWTSFLFIKAFFIQRKSDALYIAFWMDILDLIVAA